MESTEPTRRAKERIVRSGHRLLHRQRIRRVESDALFRSRFSLAGIFTERHFIGSRVDATPNGGRSQAMWILPGRVRRSINALSLDLTICA